MGYKKSAKTHGVPQTTLERFVKMDGSPEVVNAFCFSLLFCTCTTHQIPFSGTPY